MPDLEPDAVEMLMR